MLQQLQWKEKPSGVNKNLTRKAKAVEGIAKGMVHKDYLGVRVKFHNLHPCLDFAFSI